VSPVGPAGPGWWRSAVVYQVYLRSFAGENGDGVGDLVGLRVLLDIVPNHTSGQHPWFRAALAAGPGSPERERYLFRPGRGRAGTSRPTTGPTWPAGRPGWPPPAGSWPSPAIPASPAWSTSPGRPAGAPARRRDRGAGQRPPYPEGMVPADTAVWLDGQAGG
jgi:hypothetical protein